MGVWATAWDVFRRAPSRVGRSGRAAVDFVFFSCWADFFYRFFYLFITRQGRRSEATEAFFCL